MRETFYMVSREITAMLATILAGIIISLKNSNSPAFVFLAFVAALILSAISTFPRRR